jgi:hypothetical protein
MSCYGSVCSPITVAHSGALRGMRCDVVRLMRRLAWGSSPITSFGSAGTLFAASRTLLFILAVRVREQDLRGFSMKARVPLPDVGAGNRDIDLVMALRNVHHIRFWHLTDIPTRSGDVCFPG